jgi:hypothetical protein
MNFLLPLPVPALSINNISHWESVQPRTNSDMDMWQMHQTDYAKTILYSLYGATTLTATGYTLWLIPFEPINKLRMICLAHKLNIWRAAFKNSTDASRSRNYQPCWTIAWYSISFLYHTFYTLKGNSILSSL